MKTELQSSAALTQLCELIAPMRIAMLTSNHDEGALVSRPMPALATDSTLKSHPSKPTKP